MVDGSDEAESLSSEAICDNLCMSGAAAFSLDFCREFLATGAVCF